MKQNAERKCHQHASIYQCPDCIIEYSAQFDEYGIIVHDGGPSSIGISFCPWCGAKLPESKRDRWFDELEALGFDDPWSQDIPEKYKSDAWFRS